MTTEHTTQNELDRREFIRRASAAAVVGLSAPYVWSQRTDETLVVNSFGGEYQELFEKNVIQPFEKKFGVKVDSRRDRHVVAGLRQDPRVERRARLRRRGGARARRR